MGRMKLFTAAACATVLLGAAGAAAQTADRTTYVTFSGPVSIPGKTLPAGTYTFRLADSPADRHIVQIFDRDQSQLFATLLAVPAERNRPDGEPVITFKETPSNLPPALRYWYYAGETAGNEFVYPKAQAMTIARHSGEGVMAVDTDSTNVQDWKGTPERVTANTEPQAATTAAAGTTASTATTTEPTTTSAQTTPPASAAPATATPSQPSQPASQPSTAPAPMTSAPEQPAAAAPTTRDQAVGTSGRADARELPRTAGELPAVGLLALFALAGAFALRMMRKAAV